MASAIVPVDHHPPDNCHDFLAGKQPAVPPLSSVLARTSQHAARLTAKVPS